MDVRHHRVTRFGFVVISTLFWLVGCQSMPELHLVNPWIRDEWAADEAYGPTFHQRVGELAAIRQQAKRYRDGERAQLSQDLAKLYAEDRDPLIREHTVKTIAVVGGPAAETTIRNALRDDDMSVRMVACRSCLTLGQGAAAQMLSDVLKTEDNDDVRLAATRSLAACRGPVATQALLAVLQENDPALQYRAGVALEEITGQSFGTDFAAWERYLQGQPAALEATSVAERDGGFMRYFGFGR